MLRSYCSIDQLSPNFLARVTTYLSHELKYLAREYRIITALFYFMNWHISVEIRNKYKFIKYLRKACTLKFNAI